MTPSVSATRHLANRIRPSHTLCGERRETATVVRPVTSRREMVGCKECLRLDGAA